MAGKGKILVIDDDGNICKFVSELLTLEGYEVYQALDPYDGLNLAFDRRPNVVILDLNLNAAIDGLDVLRKLRDTAKTQATPVLMLTTADKMKSVELAFDLGATAYLPKPFDSDRLIAKVATLLGGKSG